MSCLALYFFIIDSEERPSSFVHLDRALQRRKRASHTILSELFSVMRGALAVTLPLIRTKAYN